MKRRILASSFFVIGGLASWLALRLAHWLGRMMAMGDGTGSEPPVADALLPWFVYGYFIVSSVCMMVARKRRGFLLGAALSHLTLFVVFALLCSSEFGGGLESLLAFAFLSAVVITIIFSPWIFAWVLVLSATS